MEHQRKKYLKATLWKNLKSYIRSLKIGAISTIKTLKCYNGVGRCKSPYFFLLKTIDLSKMF